MSDAIVLTGSALMGAYTAGALSILTTPNTMSSLNLNITHCLGTSSGALNAAFIATSIRQGQAANAGTRLSNIWIDDVSWTSLFHPSFSGIIHVEGLFNLGGILSVMRKNLPVAPSIIPIKLSLAMTNVDGQTITVDGYPTTSFEQVMCFSDTDFDTEASLDVIRMAATASSSIPYLFAPMQLTINGQTIKVIDGSLVDDTPITRALTDKSIDRVFVVIPYPRVSEVNVSSGISLTENVLDILVRQRLVRDLSNARKISSAEIIEIRPDSDLPGSDLSAAFSKSMRSEYVAAGMSDAKKALGI